MKIDNVNKRALTEYGLCYFSNENQDSTWMSRVNIDLPLNQVNIPNIHDSGTYTIYEHSIPAQYKVRKHWE